MRDFHKPGRSPVYGTECMAATSHPVATLVALEILRGGGTAVDAAIAAAAVLGVVEPHMTGIGGDCFVLLCPQGRGEVVALNGSGSAPAAARPEWYRDRGITAIGETSPHAVTVPGALAAWERLHRDYGRLDWADLWRPAIRAAEEGYVVQQRVAYDWERNVDRVRADEYARRLFLVGGATPAQGAIHRQPALAKTMRRIAERGAKAFYTGAVAEDLVGRLRELGGLHTLDDFARQSAEYVLPIYTDFGEYRLFECPPNGRGIAALLMLNVLSGLGLEALEPLGAERLHLQGEATKLAFCAVETYVADPARASVPVERILSARFAEELRDQIQPDRAIDAGRIAMPTHPDTVYLAIVDRDRTAVSFINSLYQAFGSGIVGPKSGVLLQNRGLGFVLDPEHPNCIGPGKRPLHTIIPAMLVKDGRPVMPFGVMGGLYQPVGQVQVLTNMLVYGMDPQEAIDLPRSFCGAGPYQLERGIPDEVASGLQERGHVIERMEAPLGGAQAIWIDWDRGTLLGASDSRKDGCALGL